MPMKRILIVDDTPENLSLLVNYLGKDYQVLVADSGLQALNQMQFIQPDLILLDVLMPEMDGFATCERLKQIPAWQNIPVIFMTALADEQDKVRGFALGAVDYITKPIYYEELMARVRTHLQIDALRSSLEHLNQSLEAKVAERTQALQAALDEIKDLQGRLEAENHYLRQELMNPAALEGIISQSPAYQPILRQIIQVAPTPTTVLIEGESGTGKELLCQAIHRLSSRKNQPFIKINCAALPAQLLESELFGYEKGAFTGANAAKPGRFELAHQGTLFLDEIGELPLELQPKLLRVIQEGEFERLGALKTTKVNVRLIAATNRDLQAEVEKGNFRADLFYRLSVFPIRNLPLRERKEDILPLAEHFVRKYSQKMGKHIQKIGQKTLDLLMEYHWPGNIRELENIIERGIVLTQHDTLHVHTWFSLKNTPPRKEPKFASLEENEKQHIFKALTLTHWKVSGPKGAAALLNVNPKTLESRMKRLGIHRPALDSF
ncbi:MAG: hypothetical protein OHK0053_34900 [Microscillaceae bacterium]